LFLLNKLRKLQYWATLWILDVFHISFTIEIEAIASLISIYLHFQKLSRRLLLRTFLLSSNHTIKFLLEKRYTANFLFYLFFLKTNICLNGIFSSLNSKFFLRSKLIDIFLVVSYSIKLIAIIKRVRLPTSINLIILCSMFFLIPTLSLLSLIIVLETMLLHLLLIFIPSPVLPKRCFIIPSISPQ